MEGAYIRDAIHLLLIVSFRPHYFASQFPLPPPRWKVIKKMSQQLFIYKLKLINAFNREMAWRQEDNYRRSIDDARRKVDEKAQMLKATSNLSV